MFRTKEKPVKEVVMYFLRQRGLETPLLQRRLMQSWKEVAGDVIHSYTRELNIHNQILYVSITNTSLRADLSMMRQHFVQKLNAKVGAQVITDIRFC